MKYKCFNTACNGIVSKDQRIKHLETEHPLFFKLCVSSILEGLTDSIKPDLYFQEIED